MLITIFLLIACALEAAVATPLVLKLIPPNPIYGLQTRRMRSSPETWIEVNAYGGRMLLVAAGVSAILIMAYSGTWLRSGWLQLAAFLIPMIAAVVMTLRFERTAEGDSR